MNLRGRDGPPSSKALIWLRAHPLAAPVTSDLSPLPTSPLLLLLSSLTPGTSKGFLKKKLFSLAFSPMALSLQPLFPNEEAHSPGASHTHEDGNLKLHP